MTIDAGRLFDELARRQHGVAAVWQLIQRRVPRAAIDKWVRKNRALRLHRGVYGVPTNVLGRLMAATLAAGDGAAISHRSGVGLWAMLDHPEGRIHVSVPGGGERSEHDGLVIHRVRPFTMERCLNIPVVSPTRCLLDARLRRHEAYRALELAAEVGMPIDLDALVTPALRQVKEIFRLGLNPTRSLVEARFLFLCRDRGIELPVVNSLLNGVEADFHWPRARLVLEIDGYEHHKERPQFEEDRRREVLHAMAGHQVIRVSAWQVQYTPRDVTAAVLGAAPYLHAA